MLDGIGGQHNRNFKDQEQTPSIILYTQNNLLLISVGLHVLYIFNVISCNNLKCIIICMNEGISQKRKITIIMDKNKAN